MKQTMPRDHLDELLKEHHDTLRWFKKNKVR